MSVAANRRDGCGKSQRSWKEGPPSKSGSNDFVTCLGFIRFVEIHSSWRVGRRSWLARGLCFSCHATLDVEAGGTNYSMVPCIAPTETSPNLNDVGCDTSPGPTPSGCPSCTISSAGDVLFLEVNSFPPSGRGLRRRTR